MQMNLEESSQTRLHNCPFTPLEMNAANEKESISQRHAIYVSTEARNEFKQRAKRQLSLKTFQLNSEEGSCWFRAENLVNFLQTFFNIFYNIFFNFLGQMSTNFYL